eukprot:PITA_33419
MWVKGSPLQFIVDSKSQKNLIFAEVVKRLGLPTIPNPQSYNIRWLHQGQDSTSANNVSFTTTSSPSRMRNVYPIQQIDDLLDQFKRANYFNKIDMKCGYHQVPIELINVRKTTFKSKEGLFKWLVMPFRLTNVPTTFMRLMDDILRPFTNSFMVVYLDDILIFNKS